MVYWQYDMLLVCFTLVRTRGPWPDQKSRVNDMTHTTKYHRKRAYFVTSTAVPHVAYGTVRTRMIRTTGTYYGSSYRMIPAAFHGHTLVGEYQNCRTRTRRVVYLVRECNTSNSASTPNISDVCTAAAVDTACARGSVLLIT